MQSIQRGALHLAATVHLGLQNDPYFTTQNQVEVPRAGTLRRARLPLEATIRISPTLQLTNGLPYDVLGWAIAPLRKEGAAGNTAAAAAAAASDRQAKAAAERVTEDADAAAAALAGPLGSEASGGTLSRPSTGFAAAQGSREAAAAAAAAATPAAGAGKLSGLQQVWTAGSKQEAELALARLVAGGLFWGCGSTQRGLIACT
jgi:hypothetical protein